MQIKELFILSVLVFFAKLLQAQQCGFDRILQDGAFSKLYQKTNTQLNKNHQELLEYHIPVVFHVLYNKEKENIADSIIHNQIDILNNCYTACNEPIRKEFQAVIACPKIYFYLANTLPNGKPFTGIKRVQTTEKTFNIGDSIFYKDAPKFTKLGGSNAVNTDTYLNIWVCNLSPKSSNVSGLLGYAFPPVKAPNWATSAFVKKERQGVVISYTAIGSNNPQGNAAWSEVLVHEIGHYLGLRHVWGLQKGSCTSDDGFEDTPATKQPNNACNYSKNSCISSPNDLPDMVENFMDYTLANCKSHFTKQQVQQMIDNLVNLRPKVFSRHIGSNTAVDFRVFPNPTKKSFSIFVNTSNLGRVPQFTVQIISSCGKIIWQKNYTQRKKLIEHSLQHQGVYLVKLLYGGRSIVRKIVVL